MYAIVAIDARKTSFPIEFLSLIFQIKPADKIRQLNRLTAVILITLNPTWENFLRASTLSVIFWDSHCFWNQMLRQFESSKEEILPGRYDKNFWKQILHFACVKQNTTSSVHMKSSFRCIFRCFFRERNSGLSCLWNSALLSCANIKRLEVYGL